MTADMSTLFFGARYDAPIYDGAEEVPTPIGLRCYECDEAVESGDGGWLRLFYDGTAVSTTAIHRECDLRNSLGHLVGVCPCTEWGERPMREQARETLRRFEAGALQKLADEAATE